MVERVDDGVDDRRRRADRAGLARALDAERVGRASARCGSRKRTAAVSPARGMA